MGLVIKVKATAAAQHGYPAVWQLLSTAHHDTPFVQH
jgi:hypothetical protein